MQLGREVIIEREDHQPSAIIRSPNRSGKPITQILLEAKQRNSTVTPDEDFGTDLEEIIASQSVSELIEAIAFKHSPVELSLSPVTVAELVHGIYRAKAPEVAKRRREFIEELVGLIPVHPVTDRTGWIVGEIEGREVECAALNLTTC